MDAKERLSHVITGKSDWFSRALGIACMASTCISRGPTQQSFIDAHVYGIRDSLQILPTLLRTDDGSNNWSYRGSPLTHRSREVCPSRVDHIYLDSMTEDDRDNKSPPMHSRYQSTGPMEAGMSTVDSLTIKDRLLAYSGKIPVSPSPESRLILCAAVRITHTLTHTHTRLNTVS